MMEEETESMSQRLLRKTTTSKAIDTGCTCRVWWTLKFKADEYICLSNKGKSVHQNHVKATNGDWDGPTPC